MPRSASQETQLTENSHSPSSQREVLMSVVSGRALISWLLCVSWFRVFPAHGGGGENGRN